MSKSSGNYVGVTEPPEEIFGKVMSVPDSVMPLYYELLLGAGAARRRQPRGGQARAGAQPGRSASTTRRRREAAEAAFDRVHVQRQVPEDIPDAHLDGLEGQKRSA